MLKITAIGNLTADPSIRTNNATGANYAILRIASDRRYKDKDGNKLTDFVSIKVRSPLAERCAALLWEEFGIPWLRLSVNKIGAVSDATDVGVIIERGTRVEGGWRPAAGDA